MNDFFLQKKICESFLSKSNHVKFLIDFWGIDVP